MKRSLLKWVVALICLALFLLIAFNLENASWLDDPVYAAISRLHSPVMHQVFLFLTNLVSPLVLLLIALGLVCVLPRKEFRIPLLLNLCVSVLLNLGLKHVFARPRPTEVLRIVTESGSSFPSGHTMAAACFYGFLIWLVWQMVHDRRLRGLLTALLALIIVLVPTSRVYLGAHYCTDVLGGLLISMVYLVLYTTLVSHFFAHDESLRPKGMVPNEHNRLLFSFFYAFEGVRSGLRTERNMVIHFSAIATVTVFGALLGLSKLEWIVCIILFGVVIMAELMNTAIETVVDIICPDYDPRAKLAKDTAAGAVLMVAVAAAIVGVIIFAPKLLELVMNEL